MIGSKLKILTQSPLDLFFSTDDDFVMAVNTLYGDTEGGFNELWYGGSGFQS